MATLLATDFLDARLDDDGDIYIGPNGPEWISGIEGVSQLVAIAIKLFKGEWFLNLDAGVPYFQEILARKFDRALTRQRLLEQIEKVPGVVQVLLLEVEFEATTRTMSVRIKLRTLFGDTEADTLEV